MLRRSSEVVKQKRQKEPEQLNKPERGRQRVLKGLYRNPHEIAALKSNGVKTEKAREVGRTRRRSFEEARVA